MFQVEYDKEQSCLIEAGLKPTILDISNQNQIPHMQACGGNGRCSTCQVMVLENPQNLSPPNEIEKNMQAKKGFESNIRLACQSRVLGNIKVRRLVRDEEDVAIAWANSGVTSGKEKKVAVLFSDIRNFSAFSEKNLPYDVIHHLNRYFQSMGEAVLRYDGYIDKYIGDGLMAVYGIDEEDPAKICKQALLSGLLMLEKLDKLNRYFQNNYEFHFEIGIGIHFGEAILGQVGHPKKMHLTAIGDTVNYASRLEPLCKKTGVCFLISESVYHYIQHEFQIGRKFKSLIKGKSGEHKIYEVLGVAEGKCVRYHSQNEALRNFLNDKMPLSQAPAFVRLAFHDAADYRAGVGGANASIRFPESLAHPVNRGLASTIEWLSGKRDEYQEITGCEISWADLIATAGAVAVKKCDGPNIPVRLGRRDAEQAGNFDLIPIPEMNINQLIARFKEMNLSISDLVALSGAHTLGKGENGPFTEDLFTFNNSYFKCLLYPGESVQQQEGAAVLLLSDKALLQNEISRNIVQEYAIDNARFFRDFTAAYIRLSELGQKLN